LAPRPNPQGKVVAAALTAVVAGKGLGQRAYLTRTGGERSVSLLMVWVKTDCGGLDFVLGPL